MKAVFILLLTILVAVAVAQGPTADDIVDKVNELLNQPSSSAIMTLTITTTSGEDRTFEYQSFSKDQGEKNLIIY